MSEDDSRSRLALAIVDFLQQEVASGKVSADDKDSIDVAAQCISDVYNVDLDKKNDVLGSQSLLSIFSAFEKVRDRSKNSAGASSSSEKKPAAAPAAAPEPSETDKIKANEYKVQGNADMAHKDFDSAIEAYSKAIELHPKNPIYLSNRAAAYSNTGKHDLAIKDAESAIEADPNYAKAYARLGLAKFSLDDAKGAAEAYKTGIEKEGHGGSEIMRQSYETAKKKAEEEEATTQRAPPGGAGLGGMPDLSSLFGGGAGGAGGPGGFDINSLMNNPQLQQMYQQLMQNPDALSGLLSNPALRDMAGRFMGGGAGGAPPPPPPSS